MLQFLNKTVVNPREGWKTLPDTVENVLHDLATYTLDPVFEALGDFVNRNPVWLDEDTANEFEGCAMVSGNFIGFSHAFRFVTDDERILWLIEQAVSKNKARPDYQALRQKRIADYERTKW